jgi:hypothetical protein
MIPIVPLNIKRTKKVDKNKDQKRKNYFKSFAQKKKNETCHIDAMSRKTRLDIVN